MQFESKLKRTLWLNVVLGLIPDVVVSVVLAKIFDGGVWGFFFALVGLQILYLLFWIKNSIWSWSLFVLRGRKKFTEFLLDYLRENRYPEPDNYASSVEGYFSGVATDETQPIDLRLSAATVLAAFKHPVTQGQFQEFVQLSMAYEDALGQYKRLFPIKN